MTTTQQQQQQILKINETHKCKWIDIQMSVFFNQISKLKN